MKKFRYNIEKNKEFLKSMSPKRFELIVLLVSIGLATICYDLENLLNINLTYFGGFCGLISESILLYSFIWLIHSLVHIILVKIYEKKHNDNN